MTTGYRMSFIPAWPTVSKSAEDDIQSGYSVLVGLSLTTTVSEVESWSSHWGQSNGAGIGVASVSVSLSGASGHTLTQQNMTASGVSLDYGPDQVPYGYVGTMTYGSFSVYGTGVVDYRAGNCSLTQVNTWVANIPNAHVPGQPSVGADYTDQRISS